METLAGLAHIEVSDFEGVMIACSIFCRLSCEQSLSATDLVIVRTPNLPPAENLESSALRREGGGGGFQYLNLMRQQSGLYANSRPIPRNWHGRLANLGSVFPKELHHSKSENESEGLAGKQELGPSR